MNKINLNDVSSVRALIARINGKIAESIKCYERANDSRNSRKYIDQMDERQDQLTKEIEKELAQYKIGVQWPGLYPTYIVNNRQEHNLAWALKDISGAKWEIKEVS